MNSLLAVTFPLEGYIRSKLSLRQLFCGAELVFFCCKIDIVYGAEVSRFEHRVIMRSLAVQHFTFSREVLVSRRRNSVRVRSSVVQCCTLKGLVSRVYEIASLVLSTGSNIEQSTTLPTALTTTDGKCYKSVNISLNNQPPTTTKGREHKPERDFLRSTHTYYGVW